MTGIPNLLDDNGMEYTTPLTKAHALNQQLSSVFSKVTPTTLKDTASRLLPPPYNHMDCITMSSVTAMLKELNWQPLELRRVHPRLCLLYQITNGIMATPHIPYLLPHSHATRSYTTYAHTATCDIPMQDKLF